MAATARVIELKLNLVDITPAGDCRWWFSIACINLGGTHGHWHLQNVPVIAATHTIMPTPAERAAAFRAYANNLVGAENTVAETVLATEHIILTRP